jgi:folate-binding protein YgfZ
MPPDATIPLHDRHAALAAVFGERRGRPVIASYGHPAGEYRAAREAAAFVDLHDRGVLEATGPQRQRFLQGMLSNEVASLAQGEGRAAALMNAKGAVQALVRVLVEPLAVALETAGDRVGVLQRELERYRVAAPVRFAPRDTCVLALLGPASDEVLAAVLAAQPPATPEAHAATTIAGHAVRVVRAGDLPRGGLVIHVPASSADAVLQALHGAGARPLGRDALDALRVEALRPWYGSDIDESNLLHETGLLRECHSPTKGCYVGQEVVARLEGRGGNVNKALRGLRLEQPAAAGAPISAEDREVGRVTTAAVSPRLGPIAMGYVHRSQLAPGTRVVVDRHPATVVDRFED